MKAKIKTYNHETEVSIPLLKELYDHLGSKKLSENVDALYLYEYVKGEMRILQEGGVDFDRNISMQQANRQNEKISKRLFNRFPLHDT